MRYWLPVEAKTKVTCSLLNPENARRLCVINWLSCIVGNLDGDWLQACITQILAAFTGKNNSDSLPARYWQCGSKKHQQCLIFHRGKLKCCFVAMMHIRCRGSLFIWNSAEHVCYAIMKMNVDGVSMIFWLPFWLSMVLWGYVNSLQNNWLPSKAKIHHIDGKIQIPKQLILQTANDAKEILGYWIHDFDNVLLSNSKKQEHYMNPQLDLLGDPLTNCPIQPSWETSIELYAGWQLVCTNTPEIQFVNCLVPTSSLNWSNCPELLLILLWMHYQVDYGCSWLGHIWQLG